MKMFGAYSTFVLVLSLTSAAAAGSDDMKPYPAAEPGFTRWVFGVSALDNEADRMLEIQIGKTMTVDCNLTAFSGELEEHIALGWGYPYYVLQQVGGPMSTLMACPPDEETREAFVLVRGEGFRRRYNSKLPVVVYAPDGFEVRYRIWSAGEETGRAEQR
jgi:ecotin